MIPCGRLRRNASARCGRGSAGVFAGDGGAAAGVPGRAPGPERWPSGIDLDVSLAWLPFELEAIRRSELRDYAGVTIRIPRPDDLVIYKLVAARPRDLEDVERLLLLHGSSVDLQHITSTVREFADALEDARRIDALERLLKKTGLRP